MENLRETGMRFEEVIKLESGLRKIMRDRKRRVFYHLTSKTALPSIMRHGLLPSTRELRSSHGLGEESFEFVEGAIFLARSKKEALDQLKINRAIGLPIPDSSNRVILKVTLPEGYEIDYDDAGYIYVDKPIPPEYLGVPGSMGR